MDLRPGHTENDGCKMPNLHLHYRPYAGDLLDKVAEQLADAGVERFDSDAEMIVGIVVDWLIHTMPDKIRLDNAHRSHVAYVTYLLQGGEPNQLDYVITGYEKTQKPT